MLDLSTKTFANFLIEKKIICLVESLLQSLSLNHITKCSFTVHLILLQSSDFDILELYTSDAWKKYTICTPGCTSGNKHLQIMISKQLFLTLPFFLFFVIRKTELL